MVTANRRGNLFDPATWVVSPAPNDKIRDLLATHTAAIEGRPAVIFNCYEAAEALRSFDASFFAHNISAGRFVAMQPWEVDAVRAAMSA
jgi:hypothetical protein